jgi:hypothetical protein
MDVGDEREAASNHAAEEELESAAKYYELQGEQFVVLNHTLEQAVERLSQALESEGSFEITSSTDARVAARGTWRRGSAVKYEFVLSGAESSPTTVAEFFARKRRALRRMLIDELLPRLNGEAVAPQPAPLQALSSHRDVKLKLADYDGGFLEHPRPESSGRLVLPRAAPQFVVHWRHSRKGMKRTKKDLMARYAIEVEPRTERSSLLVFRLRSDPSQVASMTLPSVPAERFERLLQTKIRRHALRSQSLLRVAHYDGGLSAQPHPRATGTLLLVRSRWVLHFPGTKELVEGLITKDALEVDRLGPRSCRVRVAVPQLAGTSASFDLPDIEAEALTSELQVRRGLGARGDRSLSKRQQRILVRAITRFEKSSSKELVSTRQHSGGWAVAMLIVLAALIFAGVELSTPTPNFTIPIGNQGSGSGSGSSGLVDNCTAGYGYLNVLNNTCYSGSGPSANNAAGGGKTASCPSGYPYFNAATNQCYTSVPTASGGVGSASGTGGSSSGSASGPSSAGATRCSWYSVDKGGGVEEDLPEPASQCGITLGFDWDPYTQQDGVPTCLFGANGSQPQTGVPPGSFRNITTLTIEPPSPATANQQAFAMVFNNGALFYITCSYSEKTEVAAAYGGADW